MSIDIRESELELAKPTVPPDVSQLLLFLGTTMPYRAEPSTTCPTWVQESLCDQVSASLAAWLQPNRRRKP